MKLRTKDGRATAYGLACGEVETFQPAGEGAGYVRASLSMPLASSRVVLVRGRHMDGDTLVHRTLYNGPSLKAARAAFDAFAEEHAPRVPLLSVDAWRDVGGSWTWNQWHRVGDVPRAWCDLSPRALLRALRDAGYLRKDSAGRCAVEDDQHNVVITQRATGMPVYALEYGSY